ncbi:MAG: right-handed parallel beta-helix repeat-containing protein, partial [Spirulinaceae cyanobacterium]
MTKPQMLPLRALMTSVSTGMVLLGGFSSAIAQSLDAAFDKDKKIPPPSQQPIHPQQAQLIENINPGLWLTPRLGAQFTTGPGAGYESSFGSFYGWIPVSQDGFDDLFYTEAQTRIDTNSGRWGGNLAVGYRNFAREVIFGGYASYDVQDAGSFTAHQLGLGLEALHPSWEARLNGYLPIGDRSTTVSESSTTVSQTFTNARFETNQLFVTPQSTVRNDVTADSSLAGFDLEGGTTLTTWPGGQLQGFVGSYLYGGPGTNSFVGFRSRLLAQMENFNAGVRFESDRVFGTNVTFTIGASWGGGARSAEENATEAAIIALLSKPTQRQKNVTIRRHTESIFTTTTEAEGLALNPDTGEPWEIIHVDLNNGNASGSSAEGDPLDTIANGLGGTTSSGNEVVYVEGTGTEAGFTIPAQVKVLSSGPEQLLAVTTSNSSFSGTTTLARSGTGNFPQLTSDVSFSDGGGELDGFALTGGAGIVVANVTGTVEIANNQIDSSSSRGIYFESSTGTLDLTIDSNTITNSGDDAIRGEIAGSAIVNATIANNQIDTTNSPVSATFPSAEGIDLEVRGNAQVTATIANNTITNTDNSGIELEAYEANVILNSTITGNTISNTGGDGILFLHYGDNDLTSDISNNTITNTGTNFSGITKTQADANGVLTTVNVGNGGFGIGLITLSDGDLTVTLENNNVTNTQDAKIGIAANPTFLYTTSTVSTGLGAIADAVAAAFIRGNFAGSSQINATIRLNTMTGTGIGLNAPYNTGSFGALSGSNSTICLTLSSNIADEVGTPSSGYQLVQDDSSVFYRLPGSTTARWAWTGSRSVSVVVSWFCSYSPHSSTLT